MTHAWRFVLVAACLVSACARPTPEQQIVNDAAAALGGRDRILAVKTLVVEGDGANGNLGQDLTPERTAQAFVVSGFKRVVDLSGRRTRTEQTRTPNFTYFQGQAPQRQVFGLDGDIAYNIAPERHGYARCRRGREGSPRRVPSPPAGPGSRGARSEGDARQSPNHRHAARRRRHDSRRPDVHAGDRYRHQAPDPHRLHGRQPESR